MRPYGGGVLWVFRRVRHRVWRAIFGKSHFWLELQLCSLSLATLVGTQADDDTRSLTFFHTHTYERATITFRRNGRYDEEALHQLNWLLRDWRVNEPANMDAGLFDILWEV